MANPATIDAGPDRDNAGNAVMWPWSVTGPQGAEKGRGVAASMGAAQRDAQDCMAVGDIADVYAGRLVYSERTRADEYVPTGRRLAGYRVSTIQFDWTPVSSRG